MTIRSEVISKRKNLKRAKRKEKNATKEKTADFYWTENDSYHAIIEGVRPTAAQLSEMSKIFQENIRNSAIFMELIEQFGYNQAEKLLQEFKVKLQE